MYYINVQSHFSAAHFLKDYQGQCQNMHGHNWRIRVQVSQETIDDLGMSIDFKLLKQILNEILDQLDHHLLNEIPVFQDCNPTAENIGRFIYHEVAKRLPEPAKMHEVEVWESDQYSLIYRES